MSGILELIEDWNNITTVDSSQFCRSDDFRSCFIIIFQINDFQIFADGFKHQKFVLKFAHRHIDKFSQFDTAGVTAFNNRRTSESKVAANRHADTCRQSDCKTFVVAVTQSDTTAPIGTVAFVDPHYSKELLTFTSCKTRKEFHDKYPWAHYLASQNEGELDAICSHMPTPNRWTDELLIELASQCFNMQELKELNFKAYMHVTHTKGKSSFVRGYFKTLVSTKKSK